MYLRARRVLEYPRRTMDLSATLPESPSVALLSPPETVVRAPAVAAIIDAGVGDVASEVGLGRGKSSDYLAPPTVAMRLRHGIVDTKTFAFMPNEREFLVESLRARGGLTRCGYEIDAEGSLSIDAALATKSGRVIPIGGLTPHNYFHWWLESVARAALITDHHIPADMQLLAPPLAAWQKEALGLMGISTDQVKVAGSDRFQQFDELVFVSRGLGAISTIVPEAVRAVRRRLDVQAAVSAGGRRLFISRLKATSRRIVGEQHLRAVLQRYGFETVYCEDLTVTAQVELFRGATAILGVHGAGLTNMLFAPLGAVVVELQPEGLDHGGGFLYGNLAAVLSHRYGVIVCRSVSTRDLTPTTSRDIKPDLDELDQILAGCL